MANTSDNNPDLARVSMIQSVLVWEDINKNLDHFANQIDTLPNGTDLIILPETFSTGFTMNANRFAENENGLALPWMLEMARNRQATITGSLIMREKERIFNRLYWISPDGIEGFYDKRHLFRMGRENDYFVAGHTRSIFTLGNFRFMPQICYDIRFPVFARNRNDYDVLFYVANWPASRQAVWEILLKARAIENQAVVLGLNRIGPDGEGVAHAGGTCAIDPKGNVIEMLDETPGVLSLTIDLKKIREFRMKFPVWKDADAFKLG